MFKKTIVFLGFLLLEPIAASAQCPDLTPVANSIREGLRVTLPPMPEEPCKGPQAVSAMSKLAASLTEEAKNCLTLDGRDLDFCTGLADNFQAIISHLETNNQYSAYSSLLTQLRSVDPRIPRTNYEDENKWSALLGFIQKIKNVQPPGSAIEKLRLDFNKLRGDVTRSENSLRREIADHQHPDPRAPLPPWPWILVGVGSLLLASIANALHWPRLKQRVGFLRQDSMSPGEIEDLKARLNTIQGQIAPISELAERIRLIETRLDSFGTREDLISQVSDDSANAILANLKVGQAALRDSVAEELRPRLEHQIEGRVSANLQQNLREVEDGLKRLDKEIKQIRIEALSEEVLSARVLKALKTSEQSNIRAPEITSLVSAWNNFRRREELQNLTDEFAAIDQQEVDLRDRLERSLGERLASSSELRRIYELALSPLESYLFSLRKLGKLVSDARAGESQGAVKEGQVQRAREGLQLLTLLQASDLATRLRQFTFRNWLKEDFRRFAEVFFQTLARQSQSGNESLEQARLLIEESLAFVGFKPMEIRLGRTSFDSSRHVGRGTDRLPDKDDGVIIGIVRYGFEDLQGNVLQPAEVVVNRRS
jgi:hypothetical protein